MADTKAQAIKELKTIPGVGISIANDLWNIGVRGIADLENQDPDDLYNRSNAHAGVVQDRCLLYVFRCAIYFASTPQSARETEKLKWWNWKEINLNHAKK